MVFTEIRLKLGLIIALSMFGARSLCAVDAVDLEVDRFSRNEVALFWHQCFLPSENYFEKYGSSVNIASGVIPTPSSEFFKDVQRRVNYYRAMVGVPANVTLGNTELFVRPTDEFVPAANAQKVNACMQMAFLMARDTTPTSPFITHDLPSGTPGFTSAAWNAAKNSNLTIGFYGVGAIDNYMAEPGTVTNALLNKEVPHRRWLLFPPSTRMASGDIPPTAPSGQNPTFPTNTLYVLDDFSSATWTRKFTAWPNDGFVPASLVPKFWSLSYDEANFANASISMTGPNGETIPITIRSRSLGVDETGSGVEGQDGVTTGPLRVIGESTIVWEPSGIVAPAQVEDEDVTYTVTMTGNTGAGASSFEYTVTLINPNRVGESLELTGSQSPPVEGASYVFDSVDAVDEYDFRISVERIVDWVEGGEGTNSGLIKQSPKEVAISLVRSNERSFSGERSLCLSFPEPVLGQPRDLFQSIEIDRDFVPQDGAAILFDMYRGVQLSTSVTSLEISDDFGQSWEEIWEIPGSFVNGELFVDGDFEPHTVPLDEYVGKDVRMRFILRRPSNLENTFFHYGFDPGNGLVTGNYIDNLRVSNSIGVDPRPLVTLPATATKADFNEATLGESVQLGLGYRIQIRPRIENITFEWGPERRVVPASNTLSDWERYIAFSEPGVSSFTGDFDGDGLPNGIEFILGKSARDPSDAIVTTSTTVEGGEVSLSVPVSAGLPEGVELEAEFSEDGQNWFSDGTSVTMANGMLEARAPMNGREKMLLRWTAELEE